MAVNRLGVIGSSLLSYATRVAISVKETLGESISTRGASTVTVTVAWGWITCFNFVLNLLPPGAWSTMLPGGSTSKFPKVDFGFVYWLVYFVFGGSVCWLSGLSRACTYVYTQPGHLPD